MLSDIIRSSFADVAKRFYLTPGNCPKHPSNCSPVWIESDLSRGVEYFLLYHEDNAVGCVGVEIPNPGICYIERLSVLPEMRGQGLGAALVRHALKYAGKKKVQRVSIGIIAEQEELKNWYQKIGFIDVAIKTFPHLPFQVRMMELIISRGKKSSSFTQS